MKNKDYSYRGWLLVFAVILAMGGLSFVPSFKVFGLTTEPIDLLSDLREKADATEETGAVIYEANFDALEQQLAAVQVEQQQTVEVKTVPPVRYDWIVTPDTAIYRKRLKSEHLKLATNKHHTPIEDFDTTGVSRLDKFIEKLINGDDVRIAFLGDSFIEGDIITVDMREQLQRVFGGRGVGLVPCDLPFSIYRTSVTRQASGWSSYSLLNPSETPAAYKDRFSMSGYLSVGHRGATARWKSTDVKPHLDSCSRARVLVSCRNNSNIELTVNDTLKHEFAIPGADFVRELYVESHVSSIKMRVLNGEVLCHGASLEGGRGVIVDNLSIRGNSGHTIFGSSVATNKQIDKQLGYDLIVLEYGLNAMQPGQRNFSRYKQKVCDMVKYCQRCFPDAAVLVLGVSDRSVKGEGGWKSINSVTYLGPVQRDAAKITGACFWDLGKVVMSYGGINGFVSNGWAAGDHIHINFKGGARIAESLVQAIQMRAYEMLVKQEGKVKDGEYPINLEPWKAFTDDVINSDATAPVILLPNGGVSVSPQEFVIETPKSDSASAEEMKEEAPKSEEPAEEPKTEEPKTEEPKTEEVKTEEPKREEPKREEVKTEEPKREAEVAEAPKAETPKAEAPKAEPVAATPVVEEVKVETPAVEAPAVETPKAEPVVEAPAVVETPAVVEAPKAETPAVVEAPTVVETPTAVEAPKAEAPVVEAPKTEITNPETKAE
jgi:hypothetical protein